MAIHSLGRQEVKTASCFAPVSEDDCEILIFLVTTGTKKATSLKLTKRRLSFTKNIHTSAYFFIQGRYTEQEIYRRLCLSKCPQLFSSSSGDYCIIFIVRLHTIRLRIKLRIIYLSFRFPGCRLKRTGLKFVQQRFTFQHNS